MNGFGMALIPIVKLATWGYIFGQGNAQPRPFTVESRKHEKVSYSLDVTKKNVTGIIGKKDVTHTSEPANNKQTPLNLLTF